MAVFGSTWTPMLNDAMMPAVDYRLPDGLSWSELVRDFLGTVCR
jgi:hypothetical protein